MITHLVIRNFAIIEELEIPFEPGLTVLTGETGAGKSIIIDALNLLLGGRAYTEVIRSDEDEAVVEGSFEIAEPGRVDAFLEEQGIEPSDGQLVIRRIVSRSGRNKVFINGSLSTVTALADVMSGMVDISSQHEHYSLMQPERHVDILDAYAGLGDDRARMAEDFGRVRDLRAELADLQENVRDRLNRIDFLKFQLTEIDEAGLEPGEEEELKAEFDVLKNAEKIAGATRGVVDLCYEDQDSAATRLSRATEMLRGVSQFDPKLEEFCERLQESRILVEEVARDLQGWTDDVDDDPARLDAIQERLELIKKLERKHGSSIEAILEEAQKMRKELHDLENAEERTSEIEATLRDAEAQARQTAESLRRDRKGAAERLAAAIEDELGQLNMARTEFVVDFGEKELGPRGVDDVEFLIAPNVGEPAKPMSRIASGGELSRIMLAIKTVHSDRDSVATYIFDEVDSGIGGPTADMVGQKLRETARGHQVLCITHLPQIASRGDQHYLVEKHADDDRTQSEIRPLGSDERVEEIARMLGGARVTEKTLDAARELLRG